MTVFRGFMTITRRNLPIAIMYIIIFVSIAVMAQQSRSEDNISGFQADSLDISIIDRDQSTLSRGLADYLAKYHNLAETPDDPAAIQDRMFYRDIQYLVTIPEGFEKEYLAGRDKKLPVTKIPGSSSGFYADQQITTFLNAVRTMSAGGFSVEESIESMIDGEADDAQITMLDKNGHGGSMPDHSILYQFLPYVLVSILCYVLCYITLAFNNTDVRRRLLCSSVSGRQQNLQLILGYLVVGIAVWGILNLLPAVLYGRTYLEDPHLPHYLLNTFLVMLNSLALAFLLGIFVARQELVSAVVNVVTLGMSFTCGVFVDMEILGKGIKKAAHFLPLYWYEVNNGLLGYNAEFSSHQYRTLYTGYGIQLLFAAAIFCVALVFVKNKRKTEA